MARLPSVILLVCSGRQPRARASTGAARGALARGRGHPHRARRAAHPRREPARGRLCARLGHVRGLRPAHRHEAASARAASSRSFEGRARLDADFENRRARARAIATYHLLDPETRDIYDGFAAGVNRYVELHPAEFPAGMPADFTGYDVATLDIGDGPPAAKVRALSRGPGRRAPRAGHRVRRRSAERRRWIECVGAGAEPHQVGQGDPAAQSAPRLDGRLLRSAHDGAGRRRFLRRLPHRRPAHRHRRLQPPPRLGHDQQQQRRPDRDLRARRSIRHGPITTCSTARRCRSRASPSRSPFKDGERRVLRDARLLVHATGPVIHRAADRIFIARTAGDGEFRAGEQFLRMMRATSLAEWKDAMRIRALVTSNYTYADRAGQHLLALERVAAAAAASARRRHGDAGARDARSVDALCAVRRAAADAATRRAATCTTRTTRRTSRTCASRVEHRERVSEHRAAACCGCAASMRSS